MKRRKDTIKNKNDFCLVYFENEGPEGTYDVIKADSKRIRFDSEQKCSSVCYLNKWYEAEILLTSGIKSIVLVQCVFFYWVKSICSFGPLKIASD